MKKKRKTAFFIVLAIAVLAAAAALFSREREYAPFEPGTAAVIRSGAVFQKVLRRSANAESSREQAVLALSPEDVDSVLAVLQSPLNPLLERVPKNAHGMFFRVERDGRNLRLRMVCPLPGRLLFFGGELAVVPEITPDRVTLSVSRAKFGAYPLLRSLVASRLDQRGRAFLQSPFGKVMRAAVVSAKVLPDGGWRIVYRPFFMRKLLILRFSR